MSKALLKVTESKVAVKLYGTINDTVSLGTDCLASTEALTVGGTPRVNILCMQWSGASGSVITITRNSVVVATLQCNMPGTIDFRDKEFYDTTENASDLVIASTGVAQLWMLLRKTSGYSSKIETAQYSVYDDTTKVGQ